MKLKVEEDIYNVKIRNIIKNNLYIKQIIFLYEK